MAYLFAYSWGSGKTYAARKFSWATIKDLIKVNCIVPGSKFNMEHTCHNYIGEIYSLAENRELGQALPSNELNLEYLKYLFLTDRFLHFENGSYICSSISDATYVSEKTIIWAYDMELNEIQNISQLETACYLILSEIEDGKYVKIRTFISPKVLVSESVTEFEGLPNIRVTESAVSVPKDILYPKVTLATIKLNVKKWLDEELITLLLKELNEENKDEEITKNPNQIIPLVSESGNIKLVKAAHISIRNFNKYLRKYRLRSNAVEQYNDLVFYYDKGRMCVKKIPIISIIFNFSRCFIDSISSIGYILGGNALAGGVSSNFLEVLQNSTESECLLFYTTRGLSEKDPILSLDYSGYLNGSVYARNLSNNFISDVDLFVTSRNNRAKDRFSLYRLHDKQKGLVYGNKTVYDYNLGKVYSYAELNLEGPYDKTLLVDTAIDNLIQFGTAETDTHYYANGKVSRENKTGQNKKKPIKLDDIIKKVEEEQNPIKPNFVIEKPRW